MTQPGNDPTLPIARCKRCMAMVKSENLCINNNCPPCCYRACDDHDEDEE